MTLALALELAAIAVYGALALAAVRTWRRRPSTAGRWLVATFGSLAGVVVLGPLFRVLGLSGPDAVPAADRAATDVTVLALLAFPWALHRFARAATGRRSATWERAADVGVGLLAAATLALPFPPEGEPWSPVFAAYVVAFVAAWVVLCSTAGWVLWRSGTGAPSVARRRLRLMASAAVLMGLLLLGSTTIADDAPAGSPTQVVVQLLGFASAAMFLLGFAPPTALRRAWRDHEERALRAAEGGLLTAQTPADATSAVLPHVTALVGGQGAALVAADGSVRAADGLDADAVRTLASALPEDPDGRRVPFAREGVAAVPLAGGWLAVLGSSSALFFTEDELALMSSLALSLELALSRVELDERERASRTALERRNEEIQALVYGISHDLRNPIVTVTGYVDLLRASSANLSDEQRHFLSRIAVSAAYMDALITDLLALSRIGRTDRDVTIVVVGAVAGDVASEVERAHPDVRITVDAPDAVCMNPVRVRQLLTNLLENAARHGGRPDLSVAVTTRRDGPTVVLDVADDGVGIPAEYRERVFGIFERLEGYDPESRGTGIGLTMCRRIAEDVGGDISIVDADRGTTFRVRLPAADAVRALG